MSHSTDRNSDMHDYEELLEQRYAIEEKLEQSRKFVTILYSDIVGYTSFVRAHGDTEGRSLAQKHKQMFLPVIDRLGGVYIKSIGDAIMARFSNPGAAVEAAATFLRALNTVLSPDEGNGRLQVRIGVASGRAIVEREDVNGHVVNVSARLCKEAEVNGILICDKTYDSLDAYQTTRCFPEELPKVRGLEKGDVRAYKFVWEMDTNAKAPLSITPHLVLEVNVDGDKLRQSLYTGGAAQETVNSFDEIAYNMSAVEKTCERVSHALKRATLGSGKKPGETVKEAGQTLYDILLSQEIKKQLKETEFNHLILRLEDSLVGIPWELLHDGEDFLCLRYAIGRRILSREKTMISTRPAVLRPRVSILSSSAGDLPEAEQEAVTLLERLSSNDRILVTMRNGVNEEYLRHSLRDAEIVHFCGHADYVEQQPDNSGWRMADGKITAADIRQMAEGKSIFPMLIFANACHSGRAENWGRHQNDLYDLAQAFLLSGVQHYIGTLSDVLDGKSAEFASLFYESLLTGRTIGESLLEARRSMAKMSENDGTLIWASYVLYGDPSALVFGIPDVADRNDSSSRTKEHVEDSRQKETSPERAFRLDRVLAGLIVAVILLVGIEVWRGQDPVTVEINTPPAGPVSENMALLQSLSDQMKSPEYLAKMEQTDEWSSRPRTIAILPITSVGAGGEIHLERVRTLLEERLSELPGMKVLERETLRVVLEEQNLGASELADPETLAILGRTRFSRFFLVGKVIEESGEMFLSYRVFDCETTENVVSAMVGAAGEAVELVDSACLTLATQLGQKYPLRGRIVRIDDGNIYLNVGANIGLEEGQSFSILKNADEAEFDFRKEVGDGIIIDVAENASLAIIESATEEVGEEMRVEVQL